MFGLNSLETLQLGGFLAVWAVLWVAAAILTASLRCRLLHHNQPLDAPVNLHVYDWAYLGERMARVLDAALVKMIAGGRLRVQWEHPRLQKRYKQKAALEATCKGESSHVAAIQGVKEASPDVQSGVHVRPESSGGETAAAASSKIVKFVAGLQLQILVDRSLPPGAHPVELKLYETLLSRPTSWRQACHEALRTLEDGFKDRLRRQDLLVNPVPVAYSAPPMLLAGLNLAWCILAFVFFALNGPPGNTDPTGKSQAFFIISSLCIFSCPLLGAFLAPVRHLNQRGEHVLAQASLRAPVPRPDLPPAELALAVALSGVKCLPQVSPWAELYPPPDPYPPSSGG